MNPRFGFVPRPPRAGLLRDLAGIVRGLAVTYGKLFAKPVTQEAQLVPPTGSVRLLTDPSGQLKCVACGLCAHVCPAQCLTVVADPSTSGVSAPARFELDELRCTGCARCVQICPEAALDLQGPLAQPQRHRRDAIADKISLLRTGTKSAP